MKTIITILILAICAGCSQPQKAETPFEKRLRVRRAAIDTAILKYTLDDSWTIAEIGKEIKYQEYLERTRK